MVAYAARGEVYSFFLFRKDMIPHLVLYQPDMPTNTGAMMRLCACLGIPMEVIEPCGFVWDDKKLRRVAMDYIDRLTLIRHESWQAFEKTIKDRRLVLLTTKSAEDYASFSFRNDDLVMVGRESAGVPDDVHARADARLTIPMNGAVRSLNVALAAAMVMGEARRQLR